MLQRLLRSTAVPHLPSHSRSFLCRSFTASPLARIRPSSVPTMSDKLAPPVPHVAPGLGAATEPAATTSTPAAAAAAGGDVPLDANGQPLTKSALKRLQKEKDLAAKKALKNANKPAAAAGGAGAAAAAPKKEKVVKPKAEVPEEPAYIDVPEGHKKGKCLFCMNVDCPAAPRAPGSRSASR